MLKSTSAGTLPERYGINTFNKRVMREKLPKDIYNAVIDTIEHGARMDADIAGAVAQAMKEWALERGATHYCHWFQPLTNSTAEKHDAFLSIDHDEVIVERFSGAQLIQSEPDASSFPSGGMRSTFEARGYTAWDPSTPAFLMEGPHGTTLCIPSVFIGYHGEALDEKTPLLRSIEALSKAAVRLLHLMGRKDVKHVTTQVGAEQEYFLVDRAYFDARPDLVLTGRTLLGALPPKGQQLEDHYFGAIPERVLDFMGTVEEELYKLGIPAKTRHNEVAPHQFEIAAIHEEANVAADHNLLIMETMRRVAQQKGMALLLHEKPFAGVNGSGKHNNWSMMDSTGKNLLEPGKSPQSNIEFITFLTAVIEAVYRRADLLRASIAGSGNDHRLGANEAPPAIMSVFLGQQLERILNAIEQGEVSETTEETFLHLGVSRLPRVSQDNTDRNRTSPFAFTGNKFEFRAVPSSMPISMPNTVLNAAVAEAITGLADELSAELDKGRECNQALLEIVADHLKKSRAVRFEGDNYSSEWIKEAARRGLPNLTKTPEALEAWRKIENRDLMTRLNILTEPEIDSRYRVRLEQYATQLEIEANTLISMIHRDVLPAGIAHQREFAESLEKLTAAAGFSGWNLAAVGEAQFEALRHLATDISDLIERTTALEQSVSKASSLEDIRDRALAYAHEVSERMLEVRRAADRLEAQVSGRLWPHPTYLDLLFKL